MPTLDALLSLPRPEYAKQTELVLVDLLWRSRGTRLGEVNALGGLAAEPTAGRATRRLVLETLKRGNKLVTQTAPFVLDAARDGIFADPGDAELFSKAMLNSVAAPRSQRDHSKTCAPVHRGSIPLQTLSGAVNKNAPPNLARAVEVMAQLGGAGYEGAAGALLAAALDQTSEDLPSKFFDHVAPVVWAREGNANLQDWPGVLSLVLPPDAGDHRGLGGLCASGPQGWFWTRWNDLLNPASGWRDALPDRRFVDWATCLARTGLAMTYLWEAATFRALRDLCLDPGPEAWDRFRSMFISPTLLAIAPRATPAAEKHINGLLDAGLGDGYYARAAILEASEGEALRDLALDLDGGWEAAAAGLEDLGLERKDAYRDPKQAPKTLKEFVRYLMLARVAGGAGADEADLYYLARTDRRGRQIWVEPGPEWMVVVASLATGGPGRQCTLQDVMADLRRMGISIERATLVDLLEGAGLTQDSPDADDAIVINSGF